MDKNKEPIIDMQNNIVSVYVQTGNDNCIIAINSDIHLSDTEGWIKIDDSTGDKSRDCYAHAQSNYLDMPLTDDNGCHNYKLIDNIAVECTNDDKQAELQARPVLPPTKEQLLQQQVDDLTLAVAELAYGGVDIA